MKYVFCEKCKKCYEVAYDYDPEDPSPCCGADLTTDLFGSAGTNEDCWVFEGYLESLKDDAGDLVESVNDLLTCDEAGETTPLEAYNQLEEFYSSLTSMSHDIMYIQSRIVKIQSKLSANIPNFDEFDKSC